MTYTLVGNRGSRAFRALWMLEELGLPYTHVSAKPQSAEVRKLSPLGKIPVLVDGAHTIPDSTAILTYLADKHGKLTAPAGTPERARQDAMTFRILDELDSVLWMAAKHSFVLPEDYRMPEIKDALKYEFERSLAAISAEIAGPYVMGEQMTVPDILLCHCGGWAKLAKFPDAPQPFVEYMRRLRARPAYQAASEK